MNRWLFATINGWAGHDRLLDQAAIFCARDLVYVVFAAALVWLVFAARQRDFRTIAFFLANLALAFVLLLAAGHAYVEPRPFVAWKVTQLIPHVANQSFPSDHTTAASAIAFGFMFVARRWKTGLVLLLLAILVGIGRIFVGIHYPVDIAGGVLIAALAAALVYAVKRRGEPARHLQHRHRP